MDECVDGHALLHEWHLGCQGPGSLNVVERVPQVIVVVVLWVTQAIAERGSKSRRGSMA